MMEGMEQGMGGLNHQDQLLFVRNMTQMQLAKERGEDPIEWLNKYGEDFKILVERDPDILERLAQDDTHDKELEEIKKEIYAETKEETLH